MASQEALLLGGAGEHIGAHSGGYGYGYGAVSEHQEDEGAGATAASRPGRTGEDAFPWPQVSLLSAAILGMVLVITVFAHDPSPWHDLFSRGTDHAIGNLSAAFAFFALSDVIAQALPKEQENRRMGRSIGDRLHVNSFRAIRCGVLGIFINGLGYCAWVHALNIVIPQKDVERYSMHACGLLVGAHSQK